MSFKKTEILPIGHSCTTPPTVPLGDEGNIKVVQHFKYLGAYCSADGTNTKELNHRVGKAAGAFRELDMVWKDRYINLNTKMKSYNACVLSTLLYGAECWSLTERDEARLDASDMRCQRKILRITWLQHKTNHYKIPDKATPADKHNQKETAGSNGLAMCCEWTPGEYQGHCTFGTPPMESESVEDPGPCGRMLSRGILKPRDLIGL